MSAFPLEGARVRVFDCHAWSKRGRDAKDMRDWKPATVVKRDGEVADVVFDHRPDKVSRGHFVDSMRPIGAKP